MEEHNLLVVSDLHLSEGLDPRSGKFSRLEDFWSDGAFARFLRYHQEARTQPRFAGRPWTLIINGDLFDFLQVVSLPQDRRLMLVIKGFAQHQELRANERDYGLGTTAAESEWKLKRIALGHQRFFAALGWFVAHGNHVAVVKGNERAYRRQRLRLGQGPALTSEQCRQRFRFYPWFYHEPGRVYVEHGGQYEAANHFRDYLNPVLPQDPARIELPWGSLFVRYLFNEVEDVHPFADNVKPIGRYISWALRTDPIGTIELLLTRGWVFVRALWNVARKTAAAMGADTKSQAAPVRAEPAPLPKEVAERIAALARGRVSSSWQEWTGSAVQGLLSLLVTLIGIMFIVLAGLTLADGLDWTLFLYLGAAAMAYFLRRGLKRSFAALFADHYLLRVARGLERILGRAHRVAYIVMGHNHRPGLERLGRTWYVNTGAWVPVYEEEGPVRGREELTFFRLAWGHEGPPELLRWEDGAGAPARATVWRDAGD